MRGTAITVDKRGMTFLLERFGRDCGDLQYVREFTQNSIDAVNRAVKAGLIKQGLITWDVDQRYLVEEGVRKLAVTDNGDGMTGESMVQHIGQLSSSGQQQSLQGNYGLGAKIAAATRNPHGLLYLSWRDGKGSMLRLHKNEGEYEIERFDIGDGRFREWNDLDDADKPQMIEQHGTHVVLLGKSERDDTSRPTGAKQAHKWLILYLNRRYFRLPENVEIRVRDSLHKVTEDEREGTRRVRGQGYYLDSNAIAKNHFDLYDARVHWWILPTSKNEGGELPTTSEFESTGHVAALFQNELYEMQPGRAGQSRLQTFGVVFGYRRVVLYVEPLSDESLTTNTARTTLILDGEPLPWAEWAAEFRARLPPEIRALEEEASAGAVDRERTRTVEKILEPLRKLYRLTRYVKKASGSETFEADAEDAGGADAEESPNIDSDNPTPPNPNPRPRSRPPNRGGRSGDLLYGRRREEGQAGQEQDSTDFPIVVWKSSKPAEDEKALDPGELVDRAARYAVEGNVIFVNRDFNAFVDLENHMVKIFEDRPGARALIRSVMKRWIEVQLSEVVAGARSLRYRPQWTESHFQAAVGEEALTAAVMPRYHIVFAIKREVGTKFGGI